MYDFKNIRIVIMAKKHIAQRDYIENKTSERSQLEKKDNQMNRGSRHIWLSFPGQRTVCHGGAENMTYHE